MRLFKIIKKSMLKYRKGKIMFPSCLNPLFTLLKIHLTFDDEWSEISIFIKSQKKNDKKNDKSQKPQFFFSKGVGFTFFSFQKVFFNL